MDLVVSETNKGKKALLYEGFTYRIDFVLKSEDTNVYHGNVPREAVKRNLERIRTLKWSYLENWITLMR
jgi:hypothetical protein